MQEPTLPLVPSQAATPDVAALLYRQMVRLRVVSLRMVELQRTEKIAFHTSSIGDEGVIVGATLAARDADWIFPGAREWGAAIVRGMPIPTYVHHAFGSAEDPAKGHSAPDHPPARRWRVGPASGFAGAHVLQAVGAAWAAKSTKEDVATIALFGEGVGSSGDFHNALNFAGVMKAPCVFVCRGDGRASKSGEPIADRAVAYGLASARVDGSDALAVLAVVREALGRAAEGKGATLIEATTKIPEALGKDPFAFGDGDPIARLRAKLDADDDHDAWAREIGAEVDAAVTAASLAGAPPASSMFDDVYAALPAHLAAQKEALSWRR